MTSTMPFHRRRRLIMGLLALVTVLIALTAPSMSSASTTPGYFTASVEPGVSTRTQPYLTNTFWGVALRDQRTRGRQVVSVKCWFDGDWATGNYRTNRWFSVLVAESYDGYATPRWLFVHASYVYNQPAVRMCRRTTTGFW